MSRLYLKIWAALVGALLAFGALTAGLWWLRGPGFEERFLWRRLERVAERALPSARASPAELERALRELGEDLDADLTLREPGGRVLARSGPELSEDPPGRGGARGRRGGPLPPPELGPGPGRRWRSVVLPDGRRLTARRQPPPRRWLVVLIGLSLATGLAAYPLIRGLTRRLERLRAQVDALGAGDLSARVEVRGADEVAGLARSFNRAAERIERLVAAQRGTLAAASHELRSPLARIRVAIELAQGRDPDALRERVQRDIEELDALIGELLLASRLDALEAGGGLDRREPVDLLALAAEEASRTGADVSGDSATVSGDATLLRRLLRNLLENARRHAGDGEVTLRVARLDPRGARLQLDDRGPGVPAAERERIFEPFYRPAGSRESQGGVGLGLALVRQIARRHGGDARCLERPGGGSRFEVDLPGL